MTTLHSPKRRQKPSAPELGELLTRPRNPLLPGDLRACCSLVPTTHRLALVVPALDSVGPTAPLTQLLSLEALRMFTWMLQPLVPCPRCGNAQPPVRRVPFAVHFSHGDARLWLVCADCRLEEEAPRRKRGDVTRMLLECVKRAPCRVDAVVDLPGNDVPS